MSSLEKMDVSTFDNLILSASHHSPTFLKPHPDPKARKSGARFSSSSRHHAARRVSIGFSTSKSIASPQHNFQPAKSSTARKSLSYSSIKRPVSFSSYMSTRIIITYMMRILLLNFLSNLFSYLNIFFVFF